MIFRLIPPWAGFHDELIKPGFFKGYVRAPGFLPEIANFFHVAEQILALGLLRAIFKAQGSEHLRHIHGNSLIFKWLHQGHEHVHFLGAGLFLQARRAGHKHGNLGNRLACPHQQ